MLYACTREDAAEIGFDDQFIYDEISLDWNERKLEFEQMLRDEAVQVFHIWKEKEDRTDY